MVKRRALTIFQRNHLFSCNNLTFKEIRYVLKRSEYFENIETDKSFKSPGYDAPSILKGSILVNAFFEPDVRTSLSFETAMRKLGGDVINLNIGTSTKSKEESDEHTIKSIQQYADIMVLRHPEQGFSEKVSSDLEIPVINGGNRNEEHPTKTLLDLYTIYKHYNNFFTHQDTFLQILIIGDIKYSKTVHSLVDILKHYPRIKIHLLPYYDREPDDNFIYNISLQHNQYYDDIVKLKNDCDFSSYDVIYTTTLQKESENMSSNSNNDIVINKEFMEQLNENAIVMHPIPKNYGLNTEIDCDSRSVYLEQIKNGIYVRMAILDLYSSFAKYKHLKTEFFI
jgi:aspartate carbamoyltransferase catalytic subunit